MFGLDLPEVPPNILFLKDLLMIFLLLGIAVFITSDWTIAAMKFYSMGTFANDGFACMQENKVPLFSCVPKEAAGYFQRSNGLGGIFNGTSFPSAAENVSN